MKAYPRHPSWPFPAQLETDTAGKTRSLRTLQIPLSLFLWWAERRGNTTLCAEDPTAEGAARGLRTRQGQGESRIPCPEPSSCRKDQTWLLNGHLLFSGQKPLSCCLGLGVRSMGLNPNSGRSTFWGQADDQTSWSHCPQHPVGGLFHADPWARSGDADMSPVESLPWKPGCLDLEEAALILQIRRRSSGKNNTEGRHSRKQEKNKQRFGDTKQLSLLWKLQVIWRQGRMGSGTNLGLSFKKKNKKKY